jgi:homocitrate synthase NifV
LRTEIEIDIEIHSHNDFGMATVNTLAAVRAGARYASVTVNGLGERAGNAALEEVVMALKHIAGTDLGFDTTRFRVLSEYVAKAALRAIPVSKPIVGGDIFAHESGVHVDAILKTPLTYEPFAPGEVGLERAIVIGKHSGSNAIRDVEHDNSTNTCSNGWRPNRRNYA